MILHTDSEQAVRNLVTGSTSRVTFQVKKAQNQQHQSKVLQRGRSSSP